MNDHDINQAVEKATGLTGNFVSDLNACHEMEKTLTQEEWTRYMPILHEVVGRAVNLCIHAAARQRAEAFLRCKGLWKEEHEPISG